MTDHMKEIAEMLADSPVSSVTEDTLYTEENVVREVASVLTNFYQAERKLKEFYALDAQLAEARGKIAKLERDAMNWKTTAEALAQQRDEYRERYRGMSDALRIMTEVFARID